MDLMAGFQSFIFAVFIYFFVLIVFKIMGRREVGQLSLFDFAINVVIGNIAASAITQTDVLMEDLFGVVALVALQIIMAKIQLNFPKIRHKVDDFPVLLIKDGTIDYEDLKKHRIQLDELHMLLRQEGIVDIEEVQYMIIEQNGDCSLFKTSAPTDLFPLPIMVSGIAKPYALKSIQKNTAWLYEHLDKLPYGEREQIQYMFYDQREKLIVHTQVDRQEFSLD
ncbi:MAG: DUF421 domain-containing protein [Turicibacter sp.]|nr:DUF421 domain-containing protein [Turicibacter sp.]